MLLATLHASSNTTRNLRKAHETRESL